MTNSKIKENTEESYGDMNTPHSHRRYVHFSVYLFTLFHMFDSNQHTTPLSNNVPNS
jgi:hypothetical protein